MISFGAKYIDTAVAQKVYQDDKKEPYKVSFVELNPLDESDREAVAEASERWGLPECSEAISNRMRLISKGHANDPENDKFYAITSQKDNFDTPESSKILAVCYTKERYDGNIKLPFLQVKPDGVELIKKPFKYNHIGTSMMDSIKKLVQGKTISLVSMPDAKPFYFANGFKKDEKCGGKLYFKA